MARPGRRTPRRTVVITALSVTSDLAGRLQPRRPGACLAGHGVAGGGREDRRPAAEPEERRAIDFSRGLCRESSRGGCGAPRPESGGPLVVAIMRETRLAA